MPSSDSQPLLLQTHNSQPSNPSSSNPRSFKTIYHICRRNAHSFLSSQYQHYVVLGLVTCDLLGIFADIIIDLYQCDTPSASPKWNDVKFGLGIAGLVFSCLFMLELFFCAWAFGLRYFKSWFHCFDATVIVLGFITDVLLKGVLEEVASLVVILRLWRFFKIVEEFSVGAQEQMDGLEMRISQLEVENLDLKQELRRQKGTVDEEEEVGYANQGSSDRLK